MKLAKLLIVCLIIVCGMNTYAAKVQKFGSAKTNEFKLLPEDTDTTHGAIIIQNIGTIEFNTFNNEWSRFYTIEKRLIITSEDGLNAANQEIIFQNQFSLDKIEANSFNIENGKVVKTKMSKDMISTIQYDKNRNITKLTIPNVKVGSIIEYRYQMRLDHIPSWYFQNNYPTRYSSYRITIPEYFNYHINQTGIAPVKRSDVNLMNMFNISTRQGLMSLQIKCIETTFEAENVPSSGNENLIWSNNDYISKVDLELRSVHYPGEQINVITNTWEDFEKTLENDNYLSDFTFLNPLKNEFEAYLNTPNCPNSPIDAALIFVKSKIKWNGKYAIYVNDVNSAIKNQSGNNAQINAIIMNLLKSVNYKTFPIFVSTRSNGQLRQNYASLNQFNTFIVGIEHPEGLCVVDGSSPFAGQNVLPLELQVEKGRVFNASMTSKWISLLNIKKNIDQELYQGTIDEKGMLSFDYKANFSNTYALLFKNQYYQEKDSVSYIESFEKIHNLTINNFSISGNNPISNKVSVSANFTMPADQEGDLIFINPFMLYSFNNLLTQETRKNPIHLDFPKNKNINFSFSIPTGYTIVEIPQSEKILYDNDLKCEYLITSDNRNIMFVYKFTQNNIVYAPANYANLKSFFTKIAALSNQTIILKKAI